MENCKTKKCCETSITQKGINENVKLNTDEDGNLILIIGNKIYKTQLPESGGSGNVINIHDYLVPITANNQTIFPNIIPVGEELVYITLNGITQSKDFYVSNSTGIEWISNTLFLEITDELVIYTQKIQE